MFVIRKKDNNLEIKAYGHTLQAGGLGEYNTDEFEEVELNELPEGWIQSVEKPIASGKGLVSFIEIQLASALEDFGSIEAMSKLKTVRDFLLSAASNPLSQEKLQNCLVYLQQKQSELNLSDAEITQIGLLVKAWVETVRFKE